MNSLTPNLNNACHRAAQLLIAIVSVLLLGQLITLVPVMEQLQVLETFKAAEIVWFVSKTVALILFFFFVRCSSEAMPDNGGVISFLKGIAEPLALLIIAVIGQALLWQLLTPFVGATGRTVYYSLAILLIVAVSIWLVLTAYRNAWYIVDASRTAGELLSRLIPNRRFVCVQCRAEVAANANYCSQCGHKVPEPLSCAECGKKISVDQKYCQYCGTETKFHD